MRIARDHQAERESERVKISVDYAKFLSLFYQVSKTLSGVVSERYITSLKTDFERQVETFKPGKQRRNQADIDESFNQNVEYLIEYIDQAREKPGVTTRSLDKYEAEFRKYKRRAVADTSVRPGFARKSTTPSRQDPFARRDRVQRESTESKAAESELPPLEVAPEGGPPSSSSEASESR